MTNTSIVLVDDDGGADEFAYDEPNMSALIDDGLVCFDEYGALRL
jgi:hypothetical protein